MSKKTSNRNSPKELKNSISTILIANDKDFRPFIELLEYAGENIIQQQLGTLLGIFEIKDSSDDSAYIVNFLTSVAKKEYFINPRRSVTESFEAALHKVNLALSELANHGNINWLGKLDAAICVLERNYLHFSVSGNARVMLLRNQTLTDISDGLASDEPEPHPIKTFVNVSSGKLENNDKIIITGDDLFHIFSLTEIKKGALRFDREKFVQFIKTALVNELEVAGTIIIDMHEEQEEQKTAAEKPKKKKKAFNAFSEKTFKESISKTLESAPKENPEEESDYTDKKTGHIYVQGEYKKSDEDTFFDNAVFAIGEKLSAFFFWLRTGLKKSALKAGKIISEAAKNAVKGKGGNEETGLAGETEESAENIQGRLSLLAGGVKKSIRSLPYGKVLPNFSKISDIFSKMEYQQKIYSVVILLVIILAPLLFLKISGKKEEVIAPEVPEEATPVQAFSEDKNMVLDPKTENLLSRGDLLSPAVSSENVFALANDKILKIENNGETEEFALPSEQDKIKASATMEDLKMIFILTEQDKIISFSSVSDKFSENSIEIPQDSEIRNFATYLTYLYLADSKNSQIYRYPRTEGGFGEKADWLKDDINLEDISDIAIDENIYLVNGERIIKLFRGQREEFNAEQSATPVKFNRIFTDNNTENIYILDSENGRVVKYSKTGELISQYHSGIMEGASDITADESISKAYITVPEGLISIDL